MSDVTVTYSLHPAQLQVFNSPARYRTLVAGRRFGKTELAKAVAGTSALDPTNIKRLPVFIVAPTQPQAKFLYWQSLLEELHALISGRNTNEGLIYLNNGVTIGVKGADNPDALRGPGLFSAILDEIGTMKEPVWGDIIRPALADVKGRALFIGTPPFGRNHLYEMYMRGLRQDQTEWESFKFTTYDNPFIDPAEIEEMRATMSYASFRREILADFETGGGNHFQESWFKFDREEPKEGGKVVTIDLAGFTEVKQVANSRQKLLDRHVIATTRIIPQQKRELDHWWVKNVEYGRWGTKECAKRIVDTLIREKPDAWGMEQGALYNAVMPEIQDELIRRGKTVARCEPLRHENKVKLQRILWALQGRFEHGRITFNVGSWNNEAVDEIMNAGAPMVHDDIPDALAYVAQITQGRTFHDFSELEDEPYWTPTDPLVGY